MTQTCPSCSQPASGRYCSHCGASLDSPGKCRECSADLLPGARFCNQCGTPSEAPATEVVAGAGTAGRNSGVDRPHSNLPWYIAGAALIALIAVVLVPRFRSDDAGTPPFVAVGEAPANGPVGDAPSVDLSSMTPRQAADRLFERVMRSISNGDTAQARQFLPMALAAYERVPDLDFDARYHVGVLRLLEGDAAAARAQADTILQAEPDHLFGLFVAAKSEAEQGNTENARVLYGRFLEVYDDEMASGRPEYEAHTPAMPGMRAEAEAFSEGG